MADDRLKIFDECPTCGGTGKNGQGPAVGVSGFDDCYDCRGKGETLSPLGVDVLRLCEMEFGKETLGYFKATPRGESAKV